VTAEPVHERAAEVRCPSGDLHFKVIDGDRIEIKCTNKRCTGGNTVVLHRYSIPDGVLIETLRFKDPIVRGRGARTFRKEVP
jgi:hypothetical protein